MQEKSGAMKLSTSMYGHIECIPAPRNIEIPVLITLLHRCWENLGGLHGRHFTGAIAAETYSPCNPAGQTRVASLPQLYVTWSCWWFRRWFGFLLGEREGSCCSQHCSSFNGCVVNFDHAGTKIDCRKWMYYASPRNREEIDMVRLADSQEWTALPTASLSGKAPPTTNYLRWEDYKVSPWC